MAAEGWRGDIHWLGTHNPALRCTQRIPGSALICLSDLTLVSLTTAVRRSLHARFFTHIPSAAVNEPASTKSRSNLAGQIFPDQALLVLKHTLECLNVPHSSLGHAAEAHGPQRIKHIRCERSCCRASAVAGWRHASQHLHAQWCRKYSHAPCIHQGRGTCRASSMPTPGDLGRCSAC